MTARGTKRPFNSGIHEKHIIFEQGSQDVRKSWRARAAMALAATIGIATLSGVAVATPAFASAPQCTTRTTVWGIDNAGDPAPLVFPAASGGNINCWLARGDNSDAVKALQAAINCNSNRLIGPFESGMIAVDGDFGPQTYNALRDVQYWGGVTPDGVYGSHTRDVMEFPTAPGWYGARCGGVQ
jgi:peptidoglycan hydrolase-like protein with peptidoglycan-binding domain